MLKVVLGCSIVAFTTLCGYLLAQKYRQRKEFFQQFFEFNERFLNEIAYYRRPLLEFIAYYSYKGEFERFLQVYAISLERKQGLSIETVRDLGYGFLKEDEKTLLLSYFSMLGKGDSVSQKGYFTSVKDGIGKLQKETAEVSKKYEDLYIKLGFLFGLFVLILII